MGLNVTLAPFSVGNSCIRRYCCMSVICVVQCFFHLLGLNKMTQVKEEAMSRRRARKTHSQSPVSPLTFCLVVQMFSTSVMRAVLRWCRAFSSSSKVLLISETAWLFRSVSCLDISFTRSMAAVSWGSLRRGRAKEVNARKTDGDALWFFFFIYLWGLEAARVVVVLKVKLGNFRWKQSSCLHF